MIELKELIKKLELIEEQLDIINGEYGDREGYCIYCKSNKYDGREGIKHMQLCVIRLLRVKIKKLKEELNSVTTN